MSQEKKIAVALVCIPDDVGVLKSLFSEYVQQSGNASKSHEPPGNSDHDFLLSNFPLEDYLVDVVRVSELDENLPTFNGVIIARFREGEAPEETPEKKELSSTNKDSFYEKSLAHLNQLTHPVPENQVSTVFDACEDPAFVLAKKLGGSGNALRHLDLYHVKARESKTQQQTKEHNFLIISRILKGLIDTEKTVAPLRRFLDPQPLSKKTHSLVPAAIPSHVNGRPVFFWVLWVLLLLATIGSAVSLVILGLILTPWVMIPIGLFILTCIAYYKADMKDPTAIPAENSFKIKESQDLQASSGNSQKNDHEEEILDALQSLDEQGENFSAGIAEDPRFSTPHTTLMPGSMPDSPTHSISHKPRPSYSNPLTKISSNDSKNLVLAKKAAEKLKILLSKHYKPDQVSSLSITFELSDDGMFLLNCADTGGYNPDTKASFAKCQKTLMDLFARIRQIPILEVLTKIPDSPESHARQSHQI